MLVNGLVSARWRREVERAKGRKVVVMKVTRPKIFASSEAACSVCRDLFQACFPTWRFCGGQDWRMLPSNHEGGRASSKAKWKWMKMDEVFFFLGRVCNLGTLGDFVAGQARHVARTTPTRHCELARCGGSARFICVSFLFQTNFTKKYMYLVDCLNTLIWFCIISQVYVDLVEDRSCANSYFVSLKAHAGNIQCFQCQELVYYFHKTEPKGDGAILIFLPGDILRGAPCFFVCSRLCPGSGWGDITKTYIRLYQSGFTMLLSKWKWHEKNKDEAWMKSVSILDVWVSVWETVLWTRDQLVNFLSISVQVRTTNSSRCTLWWRPNSSTRRLSVHQKAPERPVEKMIWWFFSQQFKKRMYFNPSKREQSSPAGGALHQHRRGICDHRRRGLRHRHRCTQGTQLWCRRFHELPRLNHVVEVVNHIVFVKLLWFPMVSKCSVVPLDI